MDIEIMPATRLNAKYAIYHIAATVIIGTMPPKW
jgi:hypothetical protein